MSNTIIKLENISKQYRLGQVGTQTLRGDLQRWWHTMRGKEDPTLKIGQSNDLKSNISHLTSDNYVWALRDINLEVKQGEILGIIGKNGAGKSTLLKLLSRVTTPTTGSIKVKGRIASLLEVGTGFHPDLTGRENIFLNGAILGMTKAEIRGKFDEIVDFAGVAKYIDTPVKRYSSGMYVRLAFAVAAHLEPDILVVDEVLAVGDAEFQDKAIGKMQDVSKGHGKTVLYVSHNMSSVISLCKKCLLLENGKINDLGFTEDIVNKYLTIKETSNQYNNSMASELDVYLLKGSVELISMEKILIKCTIKSKIRCRCSIDFRIKTKNGIPFAFGSYGAFNNTELLDLNVGDNEYSFQFDINHWALGKYYLSVDLTLPDIKYFERLENILMFEIIRNPDVDRICLDLNWNYGPLQIKINKNVN